MPSGVGGFVALVENQVCETNPILSVRRAASLSPRTSIRGEELPCKTKPIGGGVSSLRLEVSKERCGPVSNRYPPAWSPGASVPNKANLASGDGAPKRDPLRLGTHARPTKGHCAKQSQFSRGRHER